MIKNEQKAGIKGFEWLNVLAITLTHHIHDIFTSFLPALQPTIISTFGLNNGLFGLLSVIQRIPTLLNPFIGILAEKVRIRYMMIFAPTITTIAMSLMGNMPNFTMLAILVFVSGLSSALFHVPTPVMMRHVSGNKPGVGMGFYMFGGEFARTVGPIVAIGAAGLWGFDGMYRLIPVGMISSAILYLRFRKTDLSKEFRKNKKSEGSHFDVFRKFLPLLLMIAGVNLFRGGIKSFFTYYLVGYLEGENWTPWLAGAGLSVIYLSGTIGSFLSGLASDYFGKRNVLVFSSVMSAVLVFAFIYAKGQYPFLFLTFIGFFLLAPTPVFLSIVNTQKTKHTAFLNGIYMTSNFLVGSIATLLTGYGLDYFDPMLTLKIAAGAAFISVPIVLFIPLKK